MPKKPASRLQSALLLTPVSPGMPLNFKCELLTVIQSAACGKGCEQTWPLELGTYIFTRGEDTETEEVDFSED